MIIYEYIINILAYISNPGGYGTGKTIENIMNEKPMPIIIEKENIYKVRLKKAINIIELKKKDYILLKETTDVLTEKYRELNNILQEKDIQIAALTDLIDKYENSFVKFELDKKNMLDILDSYKNNLQKLVDGKSKAIITMDNQAAEISRLKKINLKMLVELKKYKKD